MVIPRSDHTAALLPDGKVLVAGGGNPADSAELFDPATGSWAQTGSMHARRSFGHTATLLPDGNVLVAGGSTGDGGLALATAELYDPGRGSWEPTGSMLEGHYGHTATLLRDGRVLVTGGSGSSQFMATSELYDPTTGTWAATGTLIDGRIDHTSSLLLDGSVLVAGGTGSGGCCGVALAAAELFEPSAGTWIAAVSMGEARSRHSATALADRRLLVAGGWDGERGLASAEIYDGRLGSWTATATINHVRSSHTATLLSDGAVLLAGGVGQSLNLADMWNPRTGRWVVSGRMIAQQSDAGTATLLADGRVLVTSGDLDGEFAGAAELFDPNGAP